VLPFGQPGTQIMQRAQFAAKHLWVTAYDPDQRFPAGEYPNQHPGGDGLPAWTAADRPLEDTDLVLWHTFTARHVVRPEDWRRIDAWGVEADFWDQSLCGRLCGPNHRDR